MLNCTERQSALPTRTHCTCVGAVPAVQRAPPAHAPQRAPPRSQRVAAWRVAASLPYGALPAVRAPRRASSRPPPSWRPPAPRESCAARAARARRPSSRPHRTRTSRAQRARAARARRPSSRPHRTRHPSKTPLARHLCLRQSRFCIQMLKNLACRAGVRTDITGVRTSDTLQTKKDACQGNYSSKELGVRRTYLSVLIGPPEF